MAIGKGVKLGVVGAALALAAVVGIGLAQPAAEQLPTVTVYKSPT